MSSATLFNTERTENTEGHRKHYGSDSGFHRTIKITDRRWKRALAANSASDKPVEFENTTRGGGSRGWFCSPLSLVFGRKTPDNPSGKHLIDLSMTRHRFRFPSLRIMVNIVPAPMPKQNASRLFQHLY
jgi:hypothetical protein